MARDDPDASNPYFFVIDFGCGPTNFRSRRDGLSSNSEAASPLQHKMQKRLLDMQDVDVWGFPLSVNNAIIPSCHLHSNISLHKGSLIATIWRTYFIMQIKHTNNKIPHQINLTSIMRFRNTSRFTDTSVEINRNDRMLFFTNGILRRWKNVHFSF